jgi:hypothetical protein
MRKYEFYQIIANIYIVGSVVTDDMLKTIILLVAAAFWTTLAVKDNKD